MIEIVLILSLIHEYFNNCICCAGKHEISLQCLWSRVNNVTTISEAEALVIIHSAHVVKWIIIHSGFNLSAALTQTKHKMK